MRGKNDWNMKQSGSAEKVWEEVLQVLGWWFPHSSRRRPWFLQLVPLAAEAEELRNYHLLRYWNYKKSPNRFTAQSKDNFKFTSVKAQTKSIGIPWKSCYSSLPWKAMIIQPLLYFFDKTVPWKWTSQHKVHFKNVSKRLTSNSTHPLWQTDTVVYNLWCSSLWSYCLLRITRWEWSGYCLPLKNFDTNWKKMSAWYRCFLLNF